MLDDNFQCRDSGGVNGVFGQLIAERAARFTASRANASIFRQPGPAGRACGSARVIDANFPVRT